MHDVLSMSMPNFERISTNDPLKRSVLSVDDRVHHSMLSVQNTEPVNQSHLYHSLDQVVHVLEVTDTPELTSLQPFFSDIRSNMQPEQPSLQPGNIEIQQEVAEQIDCGCSKCIIF